MKFYGLFILFSFLCYYKSYSQRKVIISNPNPNWDNNTSQIIRQQSVSSDSVYIYTKKKNNNDSSLVLTQYFDSLGNLVERDEYNSNGVILKVINYRYSDTVLIQQEQISRNLIVINNSNLSKEIKTYDYDNIGHMIAEKEYLYMNDSFKSPITTITTREYDSVGLLIKDFVTLPLGEAHLRHTYIYSNGILKEIKIYDTDGKYAYSYNYEYNPETKVKSIYLSNYEKKLENESFFDNQKRLIKEVIYYNGNAYLDHSTQTYSYTEDGLLESQYYQSTNGDNYYYKHFYTRHNY